MRCTSIASVEMKIVMLVHIRIILCAEQKALVLISCFAFVIVEMSVVPHSDKSTYKANGANRDARTSNNSNNNNRFLITTQTVLRAATQSSRTNGIDQWK